LLELPEPLDREGELDREGKLGRDGEEDDREGELDDREGEENEPPLLRPPLLRAIATWVVARIAPIVNRPTVSRSRRKLPGCFRIIATITPKLFRPLSLG
jgi:hypothetical protein